MMNKLLVWNCRGVGNRDFLVHVKMVIKNNNSDLIALLEMKSSSNKARSIFKSFLFSQFFVTEARGLAGGIWVAWKEDVTHISMIQSNF